MISVGLIKSFSQIVSRLLSTRFSNCSPNKVGQFSIASRDILFNDHIPANQIFGKARLFFQDFIAPFYMYLHSNYSLKTISIDDELMPSEIQLLSQIDNYVLNKKVGSWSYAITISPKGIKEVVLNKENEKITAKQIYSN